MAVIFDVNLTRNYEAKFRFNHDGGALPRGLSDLRVRDNDGVWWNFRCQSEGGNSFSISGRGWRDFVKSRINAVVTLSKEQGDDFYTIIVRQ
ncbi:hypothetical protein REPUB_Repub01dG0254300 [Reevesia pubescens]